MFPVPPLATASVPATVTAPVVADDGVKPVVPKLIEATLVGRVVHVGAPAPPDTRYCPDVPAVLTA